MPSDRANRSDELFIIFLGLDPNLHDHLESYYRRF